MMDRSETVPLANKSPTRGARKKEKRHKRARIDQDFAINCGDDTYQIQQSVLVKQSQYFEGLLHCTTLMKETQTNTVDLSTHDPTAIRMMVGFLHTNRIKLNWDALEDILKVATHLLIDELIGECCNFMQSLFDYEHHEIILQYANTYSLFSVVDFIVNHCATHFYSFIETKALWSTPPALIIKIANSNALIARSERFLLTHLQRYLTERQSRYGDVTEEVTRDILACVRYCLMTHEELEILMRRYLPFPEPIQALILSAKKYHEDFTLGRPVKACQQNSIRTDLASIILVKGGGGMNGKTFEIIACQRVSNEGKYYSLFTDARCHHMTCGVVVIDNLLYSIGLQNFGGFDHDSSILMHCFDPRLMAERQLPDPKYQVIPSAVTALGRKIYLCGGVSPSNTVQVASCEAFDVETLEWSPIPDLPLTIEKSAAVGVAGSLYHSGGLLQIPTRQATDKLYSYRPGATRWEVLSPMITPRRGHSIVSPNDNTILVCGGLPERPGNRSKSKNPIERYDISADQWSAISTVSTLSGSSLGHYLMLPDQPDVLYTLGHELYQAQDHEIWSTCLNEADEDFGKSKAHLALTSKSNPLTDAFASYLYLNFHSDHLQGLKTCPD